jgi:hypothetical protein
MKKKNSNSEIEKKELPKTSFNEKKNSNSEIVIKKISDVSLLNDFNTYI